MLINYYRKINTNFNLLKFFIAPLSFLFYWNSYETLQSMKAEWSHNSTVTIQNFISERIYVIVLRAKYKQLNSVDFYLWISAKQEEIDSL